MKKVLTKINKILFKPNFETSKNYKIALIIIFIALVVSMFPTGQAIENEFQVGTIWTYDDLMAPFSFPIYKDEDLYKADVEKAKNSVIPIFKINDNIFLSNIDSINHFFDKLKCVFINELNKKRFNQQKQIQQDNYDSILNTNYEKDIALIITRSELDSLLTYGLITKNNDFKLDTFAIKHFRELILSINSQMIPKGLLSLRKSSIEWKEIAVRKNNQEQIKKKDNYYDLDDLQVFLSNEAELRLPDKSEYRKTITKIGTSLIKPNIIFDNEQTEKEKSFAIDGVPKTFGIIKENEKIVSKYEKVTYEIKTKVDSYRTAKVQRMGNMNITLQYLGKFGHTFVMILLFLIYLSLFRKKIIDSNSLLTLISVLFILIIFLAYISTQIKTNLPVQYLIILPVASMLITVIFDSRVGFYGTVTLSLIVSAIRGNDYSILLSSIVAGSMAVYTVRDIKNRSQILRSIIYIMVGYFICIISLGLERYDTIGNVITQLIYTGINSILSPVLTFGFLVFFERVFRISTDITLLELSDFNHPLLKELASKSPGTFHHSVVIGSLAESAAESIGANPLLARVGAYYHDIGKIIKPEYYIENLSGGKNKHDKLTPHMSTLIIISHVKEGIDLCKKHKIPQRVINFIPMHHGTTLVKYFYDKALRKRNLKDEVREIDFKYPGPKPDSKETSIVMLADTVEASIRSMTEPTVSKIEGVIDDLIKNRLLEGELDNSNLTIQDIFKIKTSFLKVLVGIHHKRLNYPEIDKDRKSD